MRGDLRLVTRISGYCYCRITGFSTIKLDFCPGFDIIVKENAASDIEENSMREKKEKLVVSFLTTTQAMAAEKYCQKNRIPGRIIPLPSEISAECGIAWCIEPEDEDRIRQVISEGGIQAKGIHRVSLYQ